MASVRRHRLPQESINVVKRFFESSNRHHRAAGRHDMVVKVRNDGTIDRAPGAPRDLQVLPGERGLTLLWKPSVDDRGTPSAYRIYRDGKHIATVRGSTWFTDPRGLKKPGNYEVRAIDSAGLAGGAAKLPLRTLMMRQQAAQQAEAGAQGQAQATPNQAAQGAAAAGAGPTYTDLRSVDAKTFSLSWKPVEGAVAYGIYRDGKLIGHTKNPQFAAQVSAGAPFVLQVDAVRADGTRTSPATPVGVRLGQKGVEFAALGDKAQQQQPAAAGQAAAPAPAQDPAAPIMPAGQPGATAPAAPQQGS